MKGRMVLQLLRHVELERVEVHKIPLRGHEVRWLDRDNQWAIVSLITGKPVAMNFSTREEATSHLAGLA